MPSWPSGRLRRRRRYLSALWRPGSLSVEPRHVGARFGIVTPFPSRTRADGRWREATGERHQDRSSPMLRWPDLLRRSFRPVDRRRGMWGVTTFLSSDKGTPGLFVWSRSRRWGPDLRRWRRSSGGLLRALTMRCWGSRPGGGHLSTTPFGWNQESCPWRSQCGAPLGRSSNLCLRYEKERKPVIGKAHRDFSSMAGAAGRHEGCAWTRKPLLLYRCPAWADGGTTDAEIGLRRGQLYISRPPGGARPACVADHGGLRVMGSFEVERDSGTFLRGTTVYSGTSEHSSGLLGWPPIGALRRS